MDKISFNNTFSYKLIYVFTIYDNLHQGIVKIGETTLTTSKERKELLDNTEELNNAAKKRIRNYTNTIGVMEHLLYTTLAITDNNKTFKDKDVHNVLINSGIKRHDFKNEKKPEEWFETDLNTVVNAIQAVKHGKKALTPNYISSSHQLIEFRPEQSEAIRKTVKHFKKFSIIQISIYMVQKKELQLSSYFNQGKNSYILHQFKIYENLFP